MARNLQLQVILDAVDRATGPLKKITRGSGATAEALRASRDQLKSLESAQKDLRGFANLKRSSEASAQSLTDQQRRVRELTEAIKQTDGPTRQLVRQRDAAIRQAARLKTSYQKEQQQLQTLRGRISQVDGVTGSLSSRQRQLTDRIRTANQHMQTQQQRLKRLSDQQFRSAQAAKSYQQAMGNSGRMAGAGAGMMGAGVAKGYAASRVLAPGIAWAEQMATLQAVGRFDAGDEQFQALRTQSRDLGASTAFSANEVGGGQEFLLRAGMSADAIRASMRDVLDLALANNTELARTADIASNIAGAFKIDMEVEGAMGRVADVLSGTASRANVNLEMLGDTMKYLGGAEDLDLTLEQAAAMAGMLGNIGIQGSQAGTTMRAMMNRLTNPVGKAGDAIDTLGLKIADSSGNMRALPDILRDINNSTAELGNVERKSLLQDIFGAEAGSGTAELVSQMSSGAMDNLINALGENAGENARMARTMADNVGGDLKGLRSAWEEIGISITDTNDGPLRDLVQGLTAVLRSTGEWMKQNPRLVAVLAKIIAGIIVLTTVGGALTLSLASILGPIAMVRYGMTMLGIHSSGLGTVFGWLAKTAIPAVLGGLKAMGLFLMANPIVLVVAAIAAAAYLIYRNWDGISTWFKARWVDVKAAFGEGIGGVTRLLLNWSPLGLLWRGINAGLSALGIEMPEQFKTLGGAIIDGLIGGIIGKAAALRDAVTGAASKAVSGFKNLLGINSPSKVFAEFGVNTMEGYKQGIQRTEAEPLQEITGIAKRLKQAGAGILLGTLSTVAGALPSSIGVDMPQMGSVPLDTRGPLSPGTGSGGLVIEGGIHISVSAQPGMNEQALARHIASEVQRALADAQHQAAVRQRSALYDTD